MNRTTNCLPPDAVESLLADRLPPEELAAAEEHLAQCGGCRLRIERAIGDSQWWDEACGSLAAGEPEAFAEDGAHLPQADASIDRLLELLGPSDDPAMLGRIGAYEIVGLVGRGGMGVVFKGFDAALHRFVAIKMLSPHLADLGAARKRFAREAQAAAAVVDDHVMPIHCVSEWRGVPYLVMPYSRGVSLQRRLDREGPLELREILRIGIQTARGLAAAHAQGIVHRDVKPANILLDENVERAALVDFGLARAVDDATLTSSGALAGTPQYMSPEQARGEGVDGRSDLFSLGGVMYAMCTGRAPFRAETSYGVLRRITDDDPRPIREINPDVPEWLCRIVARLMAKRPEDRFQSAREVAELLEACLAHVQQPTAAPLPEQLRAAEPSPKATRGRGRLRRLVAGAALAMLLGGVVIVLEMNKGTLTIESEADDTPIRITQGDTVVETLTVTRAGKSVRVAAGQYVVEIDGEADGIAVENGAVTLQRGGREVVRIVQADREPAATQIEHGASAAILREALQGAKGKVEIETLDDGSILLRGDKQDVQRLAEKIHEAEKRRVQGSPQATEASGVVDPMIGPSREQPLPLVVAVRGFNAKYANHSVGKDQPPLTDEEIVSSIRWAANVARATRLSNGAVQELRDVAEKRVLPPSWRLEASEILDGAEEGERFLAWTIRLARAGRDGETETHVVRRRLLHQLDATGCPQPLAPVDASEKDDDAIPLTAAIAGFNERHHTLAGQRQPPLTEEEVVAAIRWWKRRRNDAPVTNGEFAQFQRIADTRQLPKDARFEMLGHFQPSDRSDFFIWSVRIVMPRTSKPGWTYAYVIREQHIRSQVYNDDGIAWGPAASGLWAGVRFDPQNEEYAVGQQVTPTFYLRNTTDREIEVSLPRRMTHAYYEELIAVDATGRPVPVEQPASPGGPVGWTRQRLPPGGQARVRGTPIVLGDVDRGGDQTVIRAKPGQSVRVRFVLPNYADREGGSLQTGEMAFTLAERRDEPAPQSNNARTREAIDSDDADPSAPDAGDSQPNATNAGPRRLEGFQVGAVSHHATVACSSDGSPRPKIGRWRGCSTNPPASAGRQPRDCVAVETSVISGLTPSLYYTSLICSEVSTICCASVSSACTTFGHFWRCVVQRRLTPAARLSWGDARPSRPL